MRPAAILDRVLLAFDCCIPQRYPCGAGGGRGRSMRYGGGSSFAGRETPTCRSGIGRSCCRHGRRAYPVKRYPLAIDVFILFSTKCASSMRSIVVVILLQRLVTSHFDNRPDRINEGNGKRSVPCQGRFSRRRRCPRRFASCRWLCFEGDKVLCS